MSQYYQNPAMEALVRSAVLAEQMNKKRPALDEGRTETKVHRTTKNTKALHVAAPAIKTDPTYKRDAKRKQKEQFKYPVQPRIIAVVKKPRTIMNHSYRDFSQVPAELDYEKPAKIEDMTLSEKVHGVLSIKEYAPFISWMVHGRAFRVLIPKIFEEQICPKYFGHSRYSSFLRLLNNYGFKHISQGTDRNCYYHECFVRGMPHLCKYMPKSKNARHLVPDPENEPDFYSLSKIFPLADQEEDVVIPSFKKRTPALPRDPPARLTAAAIAPQAAKRKRSLPYASVPTTVSLVTVKHDRILPYASVPTTVSHVAPTNSAALFAAAAHPDLSILLHRQRLLNLTAGQHQTAVMGEQAAIDGNALLNAALRSRLSQNPRGWGGYPF